MANLKYEVEKSKWYKFFFIYTTIIFIFFRLINLYIGLEGANIFLSSLMKSTIQFNYLSIFICWFVMFKYSRVKPDVIGLIVFFVISYIITYYAYPQNRIFLNMININLFYLVTAFAIIRSQLISNKDVSRWAIKFSAFASIWVMLIGTIYMEVISYMDLSNSLSVSAAFLLYSGFVRKKKINLILGYFSLAYITVFGARGAIFSLIILILIIFIERKLTIKKILITIVTSVLLTINIFFYRNILSYIIIYIERLGFNSRTLYKVLNLETFTSSSRNKIYIYLLDVIKNNWVKGVGLVGDRYYLPFAFEGNNATYAHNIFLEIALDYGIIIGGLIILWLLYTVAKYYIFNKNIIYDEKIFISVLFTVSFLQLMVSRSYLTEINLYIFLALVINEKVKKFKKKV